MPSVVISTPQFPNVPQLPGVPQLVRSAASVPQPALGVAIQPPGPPGLLWRASQVAPVWGVFDAAGNQVITPDSVLVFNYRKEYSVSDYANQDQAFASYNKVAHPSESIMRFIKNATLGERSTFVTDCETVADSINLYTVITPERTYLNFNAIRHEMNRREKNGAYSIEADMFFREIRIVQGQYDTTGAAVSPTANAKDPGAVPPVSLGIVQPQAPSANALAMQAAINATFGTSVNDLVP